MQGGLHFYVFTVPYSKVIDDAQPFRGYVWSTKFFSHSILLSIKFTSATWGIMMNRRQL